MLPANVNFGLVEGRFLVAVEDGVDPDDFPDGIPNQGSIVFNASIPYVIDATADPDPVVIHLAQVEGVLDSEGYLCKRAPNGTAGARGVRLVATDDPDLMVTDWTWNVTYKFTPVNNFQTTIEKHGIAVPMDGAVDLPTAVKVPASPGYGMPQAEAAVLRAEGAAVSSAEDAALAVAAADRAELVAGATDAGVAILLGDAGTETGALLEAGLAPKADIVAVDGALALKADLDGGLVPDDQTPAGVTTSLNNLSAVKADKSTVENDLAFKVGTDELTAELATKADLAGGKVPEAQIPTRLSETALSAAIVEGVANFGASDAVQPFLSIIENNTRDANLLLIADSTSNEQSEWAYLFFADLATRYPSHAFEYRLWNDTSQSYDPAVTIGAGARKVTLWNASFPGATTQSWQEQRIAPAVYDVPSDVVLISLGHNEASGSNYAWAWRSRYLSLTESIKARKPNSAMVLIGQNPATANTWQAQRIEVYKEIASRQGYDFIDVHAEFIRVGGNLTIDGIHPTPAGSRLWADVMLSAFTRTRHAPRFQETSMLANRSIESVMPNGFFTEWTGGSPTGWLTSRATSSKDTTTMETGDSAWKLDVTGDAAVTYINLDASKVAGKNYSLAVRMKVAPGSTVNTTGRIGTYDNVNNSTLQPVGSGITDGYRWMLHEGSFAPDATSARIYIYLGNIGSSITIDRIILTQGPDPTDAVQLTASSSGGAGGVVEIPWSTPAGLTLVTGATASTLLLKRVGPMVFLRVTNLVLPEGFASGAIGNVPSGYMSSSGPAGAVSVGWSQLFATGDNNPRYLQYMAISGGGLRWTGSVDITTGTYGAKPARIDGVLQWYTEDPMPA